ncbi:sulfate ABC transporter, periplasmic sulfate-binding protein [Paenibacillus algicola]|uniref:Sulfate ABC transporter, periplasmic sulfate-binding protein n=2 Tax=Paenibacillus algicola TaxID=2565926 RepID=A0A4V1G499_9BACL|nr:MULTISPECIES: sulfate ABC transporter substrate-binding protein [Paenibacillus]QCT03954.1 sulfate ABC transporter, periplasmic sulfate-binding protein [Paenibacillus algicola]
MKKHTKRSGTGMLAIWLGLTLLTGCFSPADGDKADLTAAAAPGERTLVIGAYSVVKDAMGELLPAFQEHWLQQTGERIVFQESYEASGTQARSIAGGFEADVTLLALEGDMDKLVRSGHVSPDWKEQPAGGMITRSIVVLGTREGNPKGIQDFEDLTLGDVRVLYPNPKTSGGAQWDINAIYGAGLRKAEAEGHPDPEAAAKQFLKQVHHNIESLDKSGRASMAAFEYGVGDVIVTYENELLARVAKGVPYDIVVPEDTILIENPAAVVQKYAQERGTTDLAEAFVSYLHAPAAQETFVKHGFRPVNPKTWDQTQQQFAKPAGLFRIEDLGGWDHVREKLYSKRGIWYQVLAGI